MKLETSVKVYFDDVQGMIDEIKRLQTYKLFEGDDMVLVDLDAVVSVMASHVKADNCSESPNGWISCDERLPKYGQPVLTYNLEDDEYEVNHIIDEEDGEWFTYGVDAWMPLPESYQPKEESE